MEATLTDLGASGLTEKTNVPWVQCKGAQIDEEDGPEAPRCPMMGCLGVVARPAAANEKGAAQGVIVEVGGIDGVCIGAYDPRTSKMAGEIADGETAIGATGEDFDSRLLCKNQLLAMLVGDDYVFAIDRKSEKIQISGTGGTIQVSKKTGISFADASGKSSLQLFDGFSGLLGEVVLGGRVPYSKVADATLVDAEFKKLYALLATFPGATVPDLKSAVVSATPAILPTASGVTLGK